MNAEPSVIHSHTEHGNEKAVLERWGLCPMFLVRGAIIGGLIAWI
ncbi:MAG: hypothetical protein WBA52_07695 [Dolichospermum sp.]